MILTVFAFGAIGGYLVVQGDGPAKVAGLFLILVAGLFGFLFWVALSVELPPTDASFPPVKEIRHV